MDYASQRIYSAGEEECVKRGGGFEGTFDANRKGYFGEAPRGEWEDA